MKIDLKDQSFENIRIKDTSLKAENFFRCNLSGAQFDNLDISEINLNGAQQLLNCKRINIKTHELNKFNYHVGCIFSVRFSPHGTTVASSDEFKSLLDVRIGQLKGVCNGHNQPVYSVCFYPDGTVFASGSGDNSIILWDVNALKQIGKMDDHSSFVWSVCFSPDVATLASRSKDNSIWLWRSQLTKMKQS